jgi:hypothetical protein
MRFHSKLDFSRGECRILRGRLRGMPETANHHAGEAASRWLTNGFTAAATAAQLGRFGRDSE